ncbi:casein kinase 2 regulatory subunit [Nowakowskiella sp. JEL0407]|nr:casein kinase 2 regulatory subunit [Nowakowskiella sp. JEL0407]
MNRFLRELQTTEVEIPHNLPSEPKNFDFKNFMSKGFKSPASSFATTRTQQQLQQSASSSRKSLEESKPFNDYSTPNPKQYAYNGHAGNNWQFLGNAGGGNRGREYQNQDDDELDSEEEMMDGGQNGNDSDEGSSISYTTGSSQTSESYISWIVDFCSRPEHQFFIEVPEEFIEDDFNLTGLNTLVPFYSESLDLILDLEPEQSYSYENSTIIEQCAEQLYGLIHQRFIITKIGLQMMAQKYENGEFGRCPRELCGDQFVVPCGTSDFMGEGKVKMFCPKCCDLYHPRKSRFQDIDGSCFGTTFPHLLFLSLPELLPEIKLKYPAIQRRRSRPSSTQSTDSQITDDAESDDDDDGDGGGNKDEEENEYEIYVPRIFGFRINFRSKSGPRMQWLRWKEGMNKDVVFGLEKFPEVTNSHSG